MWKSFSTHLNYCLNQLHREPAPSRRMPQSPADKAAFVVAQQRHIRHRLLAKTIFKSRQPTKLLLLWLLNSGIIRHRLAKTIFNSRQPTKLLLLWLLYSGIIRHRLLAKTIFWSRQPISFFCSGSTAAHLPSFNKDDVLQYSAEKASFVVVS